MRQRIFTVDEAQALVPHLEETFAEVSTLRGEMDRHVDRLKVLDVLWGSALQDPGNPDREEFLASRTGARRAMERIESTLEERILARGIRFPPGGLEHGLVDFPVRFEGRTVFLCWKSGEERIVAWHEPEAGYAGRRPLTPEIEARMRRSVIPEEDGGPGESSWEPSEGSEGDGSPD